MARKAETYEKRAPFKGALFDMDGLFLDSKRVCLLAFKDTAAAFSLPPMPEVALSCIGLRGDSMKATIKAALEGRADHGVFYFAWDQRISVPRKSHQKPYRRKPVVV